MFICGNIVLMYYSSRDCSSSRDRFRGVSLLCFALRFVVLSCVRQANHAEEAEKKAEEGSGSARGN